MAYRIDVRGPAKYLLVGALVLLFAGHRLAPDLLADLTGSGGSSWRLLRSGHVAQHHRNLTDHWMTAETGIWGTGTFPVLAGEQVVIEFDVRRIEGSVALRLVRYDWVISHEFVWSERIQVDHAGTFRIPVEQSGFYEVELSYANFAGDVVVDWSVH